MIKAKAPLVLIWLVCNAFALLIFDVTYARGNIFGANPLYALAAIDLTFVTNAGIAAAALPQSVTRRHLLTVVVIATAVTPALDFILFYADSRWFIH